MTSIFLSTAHLTTLDTAVASRIQGRLNANYGPEHVHTEVPRGVLAGQNMSLEDYMGQHDVFVVVIGPTWLETRAHVKPLDDPNDIVGREIAAALVRGVPLIPVLVRKASMPIADMLPDALKTLAQWQALTFTSEDTFRGDMMRLHNRIAAIKIKREAPPVSAERDDNPPDGFRKQELQGIAEGRLSAHRPPFDGVRLTSLGEVLWILGAQGGELATRYGERKFPPDLSAADLSGLNLSRADMFQATLAGANLVDANLSNTNLAGARLEGSDLRRANCSGARMIGAQLAGANVQEANFAHASLGGADLTHAKVEAAQFANASLERAILTTLDLSKALLGTNVFDEADLRGANLSGSDHTGSSFRRAHLENAKLADAGLHGVNLEGAHLNGADLSHSDLSKAVLAGADPADPDLSADLTDANLHETDLSGVDLTGVIISGVKALEHSILDKGTRLGEVRWSGKALGKPQQFPDRDKRAGAYRRAAQTNHEVSEMYAHMGLSSEASTYRLKELQMRRGLLRNSGSYGAWLTSTLLNLLSGYGERLSRILITYLVLVFGFAAIYFLSSNFLSLGVGHLSAHDAIIESFVSFHGRGFVVTTLRSGDPMAGVTVIEAVSGLFVEAILIATFNRRFFNL
jgi:uncharacterized protein YjbI with pentapeptide repeats